MVILLVTCLECFHMTIKVSYLQDSFVVYMQAIQKAHAGNTAAFAERLSGLATY